MEKPTCKNCNQLVFDENGNPTHRCVLKEYVKNNESWCVSYSPRFVRKKKEEDKKND